MSLLKYSAKVLKKYLANRKIIVFNRFASFGRNIYSQPDFAFFKPDLVFSDSDWSGINLPLVFVQEKISRQRLRDTNINRVDVQKIIKNFVKKFKPIFFVWQEPAFLRKLALETQGVITALHPKIKAQIEEKTLFEKTLKQADVSKEHILETLNFNSIKQLPVYKELTQKLGRIFVLQGKSEGGRGTQIIRSEKDLINAQRLKNKIKASQYFEGQSVNVNIVTVPIKNNQCQVYVALPSIKSTNIPAIGVPETTGGGNDWTWPLPRHLLMKFVESAVKIGHYCFEKYGLIGIWGLDSIWQKNNFKFNELNCRLQGTTEASAVNQISRSFPPFLVLHTLTYLKENLAWLPREQEFNRETIALGANNKGPRPFCLKIKNKTKWPLKLQKELSRGSGIYSKTLKWQKFGLAADQADFDCNQILLANLPLAKTLCYPGAQLCTIEGITRKSHIFCGPHKLCPEAKNLAKAIYKCFKIVNINKHD